MDEPGLTRTCARCRRVLPTSDFPLRRKDGTKRYGHCRDCKAAYQRQWYERNAERHVRGTKVGNIAHLKTYATAAAVRAEIAKCDVVCSNCHRIRTHRRRTGR